MIANPRIGQSVQVWYRAALRDAMPWHGCVGIIEEVSHGKPRNHVVRIGGQRVIVPCGNLREPKP